MLGASFAAVPLYNTFCRVTGFGGTTNVAASASTETIDRLITIRFDANVNGDLPWAFQPMQQDVCSKLATTHWRITRRETWVNERSLELLSLT